MSHCTYIYWYVVFFTFNRSFYLSTSSKTRIRADSSILKKRYKLCGHKDTRQRYYVATHAVSTVVGNAMPCHQIVNRYDGHDIDIL